MMKIPHLTQTDRSEFYPLIREAHRGAENQFPVTVPLGNPRCACEFLPDYYDEPEQEGGDLIPRSIRHLWTDSSRDEVLARRLKLNADRAAEESKKPGGQGDGGQGRSEEARPEEGGQRPPAQGEPRDAPQSHLFA